jgi:uncharacterized protein (DUF58 family)
MSNHRNIIYSLLILSLLIGVASGHALMFNIAYVLGGLLLLSLVWAQTGVSWVRARRLTRARRAQVGKTLDEVFTVWNTGLVPKLWLEVLDHSTLPGHRASHVVPSLFPRRQYRWETHTICAMRGEFRLGPLTLVSGDPFGLFQISRHIGATSRILIYPATVPVHDFAVPIGLLPGGDAQRRRAHFVTTNAAGVRDYVPGDSFNRIHWPSTARKSRLLVKEFELDPLADVWIFLDLSARSLVERPGAREFEIADHDASFALPPHLPPSTEEYAVVVAASLAKYFLDKGRNLGFLTYGPHREIIQPDRSYRQLDQVLELLAIARSTPDMVLEQMLRLETDYLGRGTTLIIITADQTEGWVKETHVMARRGMRVVAVLLDPASFGGPAGTLETQARLAALNIPTYIVRQGDDLTTILSRRQR